MSLLKEKAIKMITEIPDNQVIYLIDIMQGLNGLYGDNKTESHLTKMQALERIQKYRGKIPNDLDYKKELMEARAERYESID